jgi:hypothetical protein
MNNDVDERELITTKEQIIYTIKKIPRLEEKLGNFLILEPKYFRFDMSDIHRALSYIIDAQILELYKASMELYDSAGVDRPYFTQRALPTINQGVPIILSINESYRGNTDLIIRTNPKKDPKNIIICHNISYLRSANAITYKQF